MPAQTPPAPIAPLDITAASEFLAGDWHDSGSDTIYFPADLATKLLDRQGWVIEPSRGGNAYTLPGRTPRSQGGRFGTDYFWQRDEAITHALVAEALR